MKRSGFSLDSRNIGGRQALLERMLRHQQELRRIKSTIGPQTAASRERRSSSSRRRRRKPSSKKRSAGQRRRRARPPAGDYGGVDSTPPATYHLAETLSRNRRRHGNRQAQEHERRRQQLQERIDAYPTPSQREQNPFDPVAHPAVVVRYTRPRDTYEFEYEATPKRELYVASPYRPDEFIPVAEAEQRRRKNRGEIFKPKSKAKRKGGRRPGSAMPSRRTAGTRKTGKRRAMGGRSRPTSAMASRGQAQEPVEEAAPDPYTQLKQHLFNLIVEHRIYRESDLAALFAKARDLNQHLDQHQVDQVILELREELDVQAELPPPRHEQRAHDDELDEPIEDEAGDESDSSGFSI